MNLYLVHIELDIEGYCKHTVQLVQADIPAEAKHIAIQQEAHGNGFTKLGNWYRCNASGFLMRVVRVLEVNTGDKTTLEKYL